MKKLILPVCIFMCCLAGCSKTNKGFAYSGTLTGADPTMTSCSGGIFFKTDSKVYHIESLPGIRVDSLYRLSFPVTFECNGNPTGRCAGLAQDGYFNVTAYKF